MKLGSNVDIKVWANKNLSAMMPTLNQLIHLSVLIIQ